ncbi:MAG: methyltransferase domain-containing protein [Chloroflexi bacterium]|nr:methyltransferase domain-containing protein [Chloroflexota bacterium]
MIKTKYIRRHYIEEAVKKFRPEGKCLEVGSGKRWQYYAESKTLNRDASAEPDFIGDAEHMEFEDGEFQSIVCLEVIEHTTSPEKLISEIYRVLEPNGKLLVTVPFVFEIHDECDYFRFTQQGLTHLFKEFKSVEITPNGGKYCVIFHFLRLGKMGRLLYPLFNNIGYAMDKIFKSNAPRITLGYTLVATR